MTRAFLTAITLLALTIALVACGGDDSQDDPEAIEEVVTRAVTESDLSVRCEGSLSAELLERVHGDEEGCRDHADGDEQADDAKVTEIEVDGDTATARLELVGGPSPGTAGSLELVREDGDWRIDELGVDLLRDLVAAGLDSPESGAAQLDPDVRSCLHEALDDLPDEEFRDYAYAAIGEKPEAEAKLQGLARDCLASEGEGEGEGVAITLNALEQAISRQLQGEGFGGTEVNCVLGRVRENLTPAEIRKGIRDVANGSASLVVVSVIQAARKNCGLPEGEPEEQLEPPG